MKIGDWVIVEDCTNKSLVGKVSRVLSFSIRDHRLKFEPDVIIWDPTEGEFDWVLMNIDSVFGWLAKVRPLTLLEKELYEL